MHDRRSFRDWLADAGLMLGAVAITLAAAAFSLAPVWV